MDPNVHVGMVAMDSGPRRISWISPPPEICCLCKEPLGDPDETSSWNGNPAHRDCVRVHLMQRDPAFRESADAEESAEEPADSLDGVLPRDDDEIDFD
jgi:hypothetical protein